jgi:hypothetical protein
MDTVTVIVSILFLSWTIAVVSFGRKKPQPSLRAETVEKQEHVSLEQTQEQKEEETPQKPVQRGKFPAFVDKLSEKELFDRLKAALNGRLGEAIKIASGGETFWFSGYRTDKGFFCSNDGTDLHPITFYYN